MKISKLFHWLYAILMFLPILVFIPNAFYYGFNETAVAQEKTELVPTYYETNEVTSIDDLIDGHAYTLVKNSTYNSVICCYEIKLYGTWNTATVSQNYPTPFFLSYSNDNYVKLDSNTAYRVTGIASLDFVYKENNINNLENIVVANITPCYNFFKEYIETTTNMSITDSMSCAWRSTWQNDLFSWSYDSFLTQPFLYISNLFNVPATNTLLYCLSYWLNISIIWLCFDVVMYVPLLVHRWLDKGIVE